jgi:GNAT acetyltransferase-like protein
VRAYPLPVDEIAVAVEAVVGWHDAWMKAFGLRTERDADAWRLLDAAPKEWYFTAIARRADAPPEALAGPRGTVCDSWSRLDLAPFGFERRAGEPWFFRPAGPLPPAEPPSELEIVVASTPAEIAEFEAVSVRGFGNESDVIEPGSGHPATILGDERMTSWIARTEGRAVAAAMSYRTDDAIGVFGVTTVASARRRGYGTAVTRAAMLTDSGLPAVLAPSPEAESLYERLGFRAVGALRIWWRALRGST